MAGIQRIRNVLENIVQSQEDCIVPVPQYVEVPLLEESRSRKVVFDAFCMLAAIQFDDESRLQADEIGEVRTDAVLPSEFPSAQATAAQMLPEPEFRRRLLTPQSMLPRIILFSAHRKVLLGLTMAATLRTEHRSNCRIFVGKSPSPAFGTLSPPKRGEGKPNRNP